MATQFAYPLLTAEEFLKMDFGEHKAELDRGVIRMMAGGTRRHSHVQSNMIQALGSRLRGSGCIAHGSDMAVRTPTNSIRYPDVSVYRGRETRDFDEDLSDSEPRVVVEVLSHGTARTDLKVKLDEYCALPSIETIVFVDIGTKRLGSSSAQDPRRGRTRRSTRRTTCPCRRWASRSHTARSSPATNPWAVAPLAAATGPKSSRTSAAWLSFPPACGPSSRAPRPTPPARPAPRA